MRNLFIVERCLHFDIIDEAAKSRAENYSSMGSLLPLLPNGSDRFLNLGVDF